MPRVFAAMAESAVSPTIGVSFSSRALGPDADPKAARQAKLYREAIERQGAVARSLASRTSTELDGLDGLVLAGGGDIDLELCRYDSQPDLAKLKHVDRARDELEFSLCHAALDRAMPLLGICRGAQVLGVALGGSLLWDIASEVNEMQCHQRVGDQPEPQHWIEIAERSRLAAILGRTRAQVNSAHHQANSRLGQGLTRAAWSEDGVTEAIELSDAGFAIGVQWHPERMRQSGEARAIFAAFAAAARDYHLREG
jgi:gamma-glutamyl-gamma-aminobutyrate hydrolase PuuD